MTCTNLEPSEPVYIRLAGLVIVTRDNPQLGSGAPYQASVTMLTSLHLVCMSSYRIQKANVSMYVNDSPVQNPLFTGTFQHLSAIDLTSILEAVDASISQSSLRREYDSSLPRLDSFLNLMVQMTPKFDK